MGVHKMQGSVFFLFMLSISSSYPLPRPNIILYLRQHQQDNPQNQGEGNFEITNSVDEGLNQEILSFQQFANTKENLLTAQSENLAAEMKDLEKEMEEKLKLLEDQLQTKQEEEQKLRFQLEQRKYSPDWGQFARAPDRESSERGDNRGAYNENRPVVNM